MLSIHVANKIAAGEVVDRPASVSKELIENAVDAGASQIDVDIVAGGRKLMAVHDNGTGMGQDDALLCIERQATSKIRDVDDIEHIVTLGFRGEALAAIASVSRFRLATRLADAPVGTELLVIGGKLQEVRETGGPVGTTVEVRDLFFNVPARRKFLRSHATELAHVRAGFIVQALAHPVIGMSLRVDGREAYRLAAGASLADRLRDLFGPDYIRDLRPVDHEEGGIRVSGFVGLPALGRADRNEQYVFVNGRPAGAPLLNYAIREGYHAVLPGDRHPVVHLFLVMDPGQVDVNVHPTKKEVRFRHPTDVRDAVIRAILGALRCQPSQSSAGEAPRPIPDAVARAADNELRIDDLPPTRTFRYPRRSFAEQGAGAPVPAVPGAAIPGSPVADGDGVSLSPASPPAEQPPTAAAASPPWSWCRVVGQIGGLYVVLETEDGYVLMDPHAAHERVLFEKFMAEVLNGAVQVQGMLLAETVELQPRDAARVRKNLPLFREMGFGIAEFGGDAFVVDAMPAHFVAASAEALLKEISLTLEQAGARGGTGRWREEAVAQAACKAAVKARDRLSLAEIERLVVDLAGTELPYTCPHGRPTLIFTSFRDLNRRFGRE